MKIKKQELLFIIILVSIAFLLRFYDILNFPWGLHVDEVENAILSTNANWQSPVVYFSGWRAGGKEPIFIFLLKFSRELIFGNTILALRIVPVIIGTLTILLYYLFNKQLFKNPKLAFLLTLPLCFSVTHIVFSRLVLRTILVPFLIILIANFFVKYVHTKNKLYLYLYSILLGIGIYTYTSFIAIIPIGIFILLFLVYKKIINLKSFFSLCLITLMVITPMLHFWTNTQNRAEYFRRSKGISITNPIWHHNSEKWFIKTLFINNPLVALNKLTINSYTDQRNNYRYQIPYVGMVDPFIWVLFFLLLYFYTKTCQNKKDKIEKLIVAICILGASALGAIVTVELRGYTIRLLPTYTFIYLFLSYLAYYFVKKSKKIPVFIVILVISSIFFNFYTTFVNLKTQWATRERFDEDYFNLSLIIKKRLKQNPNLEIYIPDGDERYKNIFYVNFGSKNIKKINQQKVFNYIQKSSTKKIMLIRESDFNKKVNKYSKYKERITNITIIPKLRAYSFVIVEFN